MPLWDEQIIKNNVHVYIKRTENTFFSLLIFWDNDAPPYKNGVVCIYTAFTVREKEIGFSSEIEESNVEKKRKENWDTM